MRTSLLLLPALALSAALVGCDRPDDGRTVGQKVDDAVATTDRRTDEAQADAARAAQNAGDAARDAGTRAADATQTAGARAADAVSDATITAEVKSALAADPQLSALRIDVDTHNGVVTLKGPAPDEQSRSRATQLAAAPQGVTKVENQLTLKNS